MTHERDIIGVIFNRLRKNRFVCSHSMLCQNDFLRTFEIKNCPNNSIHLTFNQMNKTEFVTCHLCGAACYNLVIKKVKHYIVNSYSICNSVGYHKSCTTVCQGLTNSKQVLYIFEFWCWSPQVNLMYPPFSYAP